MVLLSPFINIWNISSAIIKEMKYHLVKFIKIVTIVVNLNVYLANCRKKKKTIKTLEIVQCLTQSAHHYP